MRILAILLLIASVSAADDRVDRAKALAYDMLQEERSDSPSVATFAPDAGGSVSGRTASVSDEKGVCQCRGYNKPVCFCLQNGVQCKCSSVKGSVWNLEDGRATTKTGDYANPSEVAVSDETPKTDTGYPVTYSRGWNYWTDSDGVRWNDQGNGLSEGRVFSYQNRNLFVYRNGRMHDYGEAPEESKRAAPKIEKPAIRKSTGRWVKHCYGGYCRWEWVPY